MDSEFKYFYEKKGFGPAIFTQTVPQQSLEKFHGKLPDQLLTYWMEYGWSGYADGLLWTVDPDEYQPVLDAWIGDTQLVQDDEYHVIARSAFGKIFVWGKKNGLGIKINSVHGMIFPTDQSADIQAGEADLITRVFFATKKKPALTSSTPSNVRSSSAPLRCMALLTPMKCTDSSRPLPWVGNLSSSTSVRSKPSNTSSCLHNSASARSCATSSRMLRRMA